MRMGGGLPGSGRARVMEHVGPAITHGKAKDSYHLPPDAMRVACPVATGACLGGNPWGHLLREQSQTLYQCGSPGNGGDRDRPTPYDKSRERPCDFKAGANPDPRGPNLSGEKPGGLVQRALAEGVSSPVTRGGPGMSHARRLADTGKDSWGKAGRMKSSTREGPSVHRTETDARAAS